MYLHTQHTQLGAGLLTLDCLAVSSSVSAHLYQVRETKLGRVLPHIFNEEPLFDSPGGPLVEALLDVKRKAALSGVKLYISYYTTLYTLPLGPQEPFAGAYCWAHALLHCCCVSGVVHFPVAYVLLCLASGLKAGHLEVRMLVTMCTYATVVLYSAFVTSGHIRPLTKALCVCDAAMHCNPVQCMERDMEVEHRHSIHIVQHVSM